MSFLHQKESEMWAESLDVDEIFSWEERSLRDLLNAIFAHTVSNEIGKLRKERCCGCKVDHPSPPMHECLMLSFKEAWELYGLDAMTRICDTAWVQFIEAIRVVKMDYRGRIYEYFENMTGNSESTLGFLMNLNCSSYEAVLGYLSYWIADR